MPKGTSKRLIKKLLPVLALGFFCLFILAGSPNKAFAGSCSSNAGSGGGNWSSAASWTGTCTGTSGIPAIGDTVTIASGNPITLDTATPALASLTINDVLNGGTAFGINTALLSIGSTGTLTLTASTVTISGTSASPFINSGTFNAGNSTIKYTGDANLTIPSSISYYNLILQDSGSSGTYTLGAMTITNNFTSQGSNPVNMGGTITVGGITLLGGTNTFDTISSQNYTLNTTWLEIEGGTFKAEASTINITGTTTVGANWSGLFTYRAGTFTPGTSTVNFSGTTGTSNNSLFFTGGGSAIPFYNLTISGAGTDFVSEPITILSGGTISIQNGIFSNTSGYAITGNGSNTISVSNGATDNFGVLGSSEYSAGFTTFNFAPGSTVNYTNQAPIIATTYGNLTISGGSNPKTLTGTTTVVGTLTVSSPTFDTTTSNYTLNVGNIVVTSGGNFNARGSTINLTGTSGTLFTNSSGTFTAGTSTLNMTGSGAVTINSGSIVFYNLTASGTGTYTMGGQVVLLSGGTLSVTGGVFNASTFLVNGAGSNTLSVSNATLGVGATTFAANYSSAFTTITLGSGSTVAYLGSTQTISNSLSYVNLSVGGSGTKTLGGTTSLASGGTLSVTGGIFNPSTFTMTGSSSTLSVTNAQINVGSSTFGGSYSGFITITLGTGSTVNYAGGTSTIDSTQSYVNLSTSGSGTYSLNGTTTATGTVTIGSGTTLDTTSANNYTLNAHSILMAGTFTPEASTVNITNTSGTLFTTSGTLIPGTSTIVLTGNGAVNAVSTVTTFYNLTIAGTSTVTLNGTTTVTNTFTINSGVTLSLGTVALTVPSISIPSTSTLTATSSTITITGTSGSLFTNNGTFTQGTSTVKYTGDANLTIPSTNITYNNLTLNPTITAGRTYTLGAMAIGAIFTIQPTAASVLNLSVVMAGNISTGTSISITSSSSATSSLDTSSSNYSLTGGTTLTLAGTATLLAEGSAITATTMSIGTLDTLNAGSSTITLTGTGTVFNMNTTSTFTGGTSTIKITNTSISTITFTGGGKTYYNVWFSRGASTAINTISSSNTFSDFKDDGSAAHTDKFTAGTTQTVATFHVSGSAGNVITLTSTTTAAFTLSAPSGTISSDYLNIQHSIATGGALWYAGANSVNNQGVTTAGSGWFFTVPDVTGPIIPSIPLASTVPTYAVITWAPATDSGVGLAATPYTVQYSQDPTFATGTTTVNTSATTINTVSLTNGTWYVQVTATDLVGNVSTISSSSFYFASTLGGAPLNITLTPSAPMNTQAGQVTYPATPATQLTVTTPPPGLAATITPTQIGLPVSIASTSGCTATTLYSATTGIKCPAASQPAVSSCTITSHLSLGSRGTEVKCLQTLLNLKPVDGIFGKGTKAALIVFQKEHRLGQDGIVGPQTRTILN